VINHQELIQADLTVLLILEQAQQDKLIFLVLGVLEVQLIKVDTVLSLEHPQLVVQPQLLVEHLELVELLQLLQDIKLVELVLELFLEHQEFQDLELINQGQELPINQVQEQVQAINQELELVINLEPVINLAQVPHINQELDHHSNQVLDINPPQASLHLQVLVV
jgi:hypothetical protein